MQNAQLSARARKRKNEGKDVAVDVRCDFLLPTVYVLHCFFLCTVLLCFVQISIPSTSSAVSGCKLPAAVQIQGAKITATNCCQNGNSDTAVEDLITTLKDFRGNLFCGDTSSEFPSHKDDLTPLPEIASREIARSTIVWSFTVDQCWAQFLPVSKEDGEQVRPELFLGSVPVSAWLAIPFSNEGKDRKMEFEANIYVIIKITDLVLARLNHSEYLFLYSLQELLQKLLVDASELLVKEDGENKEQNVLIDTKVSIVASLRDIHVSIVPPQEQLQRDSQSQCLYGVDSRQSPAVEESTNNVEKNNNMKQGRMSSLVKEGNRIGEVAQECDVGPSQESSDSGNHSVAHSVSAECSANISKDAWTVSHSSSDVRVESNFQSSSEVSSSLPVLSHGIQDAICTPDKVPSVTVTKPQLSEEKDLVADYEIINPFELGSSTSLSSQESAMSSGSGFFSDLGQLQSHSTTEFSKQKDCQIDSYLVLQQLPSSNFFASDVPLSVSRTHKNIDQTEVSEELNGGSLLCKSNEVPNNHKSEPVVLPTDASETTYYISDAAVPSMEVSSILSTQHSNNLLDTVTVVEVRLKETEIHCQVDKRGTVLKVKSPDFWLKEDQLSAQYLMDLEHKRRRRAVEFAVSPSEEKAQLAVRFHVLTCGQQEADCLACVKVNGMNGELQLPTALAMVDFIDDEVIPVPAILPLDVQVENSRFAVRIPEFDASMALKYSSRNLTYSPTPLVFQVDSVKITRGTDGAFVINNISHELTDGSEGKRSSNVSNRGDTHATGEEKHHCKLVDVETTTELPCSDGCSSGERKTQGEENRRSLLDVSQGTSNREHEWVVQENDALKQSLKQLSDEVAALKQVAQAAQLGKQALLETISSLQEQCSEADEYTKQLESEILSLKSVLVAQELAAEGVSESPRWQRRSPDK